MSQDKQRKATCQPAGDVNARHGSPDGMPDRSGSPVQSRQRQASGDRQHALGRLHDVLTRALEDMKARDLREIDLRGRSSLADMLIIASGTSSRHVRFIAEEVARKGKQAGWPLVGMEGEDSGEWVLVDMGDIVVHVMQSQTREFYALERLWEVGPGQDSASAGS